MSELASILLKDIQKEVDKKLKEKILNHPDIQNKILDFFQNETEFRNFVEQFKKALNIQVCFVIDITGSMDNYKNFLNKTFGLVVDALLEFMNEDSKKRYAYVGYRERDEEFVFENFNDNIEIIREKIKNSKLDGGGDAPEDIEFAFEKIRDEILFGQGGTRIVVHIADAPCHGKDYHDFSRDDFPDRSKNIPKLLKHMICNLGCAYWFIKVADHTDKMIAKFNEILANNTTINTEFNQVNVIDVRNLKDEIIKKKFLDNILKTTLQTAKILGNK